MKKTFHRLASAFVVLIFSCFAFGDDFKSATFATSLDTIRVHADQFMLIRNFTQENGTTRGMVMVTKPPGSSSTPGTPVPVLAAAILTASTPEVINNVVIAGPADVDVTCGNTTGNCFISYKKDSN